MGEAARITVICGHYGCGKTNLALNLALEAAAAGETVTVVDLDIVNPYFRSSEYGACWRKTGCGSSPQCSPAPPWTPPPCPRRSTPFSMGAPAGCFSTPAATTRASRPWGASTASWRRRATTCSTWSTGYRVLSQTPEEAAALLAEIETASRLKATAVVNNSHLGVETKLSDLTAALPFAQKAAELTGLPLLYSTAPDFALAEGETLPEGFKPIRRYVKFLWEQEEQ